MAATLDDIASLLTQQNSLLLEQNSLVRLLLTREQIDVPKPPSTDPWARVRELAKFDVQASKELAWQLNQEDKLRRREEKKRRKAA